MSAARYNPSMKVYVNTILALPWTEAGEAPDWQRLYDRREDDALATVPAGGVYLTAWGDVQKDRLVVEIVAWGRGLESWSVDYRTLAGDPVTPLPWAALDELLVERFVHAGGGSMAIGRLAIDTGYATQKVYAWMRRQSPACVLAVKGVERLSASVGVAGRMDVTGGGQRQRRGLPVWPVGSSRAEEHTS